jgi:hypothetical protein
MPQPIRVDNSRPASVRDTARILGVSKKRTDELVRLFERTVTKDAKTGKFVIRAKKSGKNAWKNRSRNASAKAHKTSSRRKA